MSLSSITIRQKAIKPKAVDPRKNNVKKYILDIIEPEVSITAKLNQNLLADLHWPGN